MVKFTKEHKADSRGDFFPEGTFKVKIADINFDTDAQDREYVDFTVTDDDKRAGTARMWFTTDAAINYTFNIIKGIFVHNAPEGKKDEVRSNIDAIEDNTQLEKACKMLIGKECWYQVVKTDRTYTAEDGTVKNSYNRNIYGYEPSPRKVTPEVSSADTGPIKTTNADGEEIEIADF